MTPFFAFPPDIGRVIYTTNAIESLNMQLRKIIKTRGRFPSGDAVIMQSFLDPVRLQGSDNQGRDWLAGGRDTSAGRKR